MADKDDASIKAFASQIVAVVSPGDVFVVEEGFDDLAKHWEDAKAQDEGRFTGGAESATFAALVVPFLLHFLREVGKDVAKDLAKDGAKKALAALLAKCLNRRADGAEIVRLRAEVDAEINRRGFSKRQKVTLRSGFATLFEKLEAKD